MPSDISIVIADVTRLPAIREGMPLGGRAMHFTGGNLGAALESVRMYQPKLVAIDALLAGCEVSPVQRPSLGCNIKWSPGNEPDYVAAAP